MKVMKFGGATLTGGAGYVRIAELVESERRRESVAVVLSAAAGVTDKLHEALASVERNRDAVSPIVEGLRGLHQRLAQDSIADSGVRADTLETLSAKIARLERVLYGVAYTEEVTEKTRDYVVSFGERLSCPVLAGCLRARGVKTSAFDADEIGLLTDGRFGAATALLEAARENLSRALERHISEGEVPIITGYFGCDRDGRTTTFGRGGSDYTAGVVAYALRASVLEVWKDVPGFMTADPKVVPGAREIDLMSYEEAAELAYFGAKVLHPRIVEPTIEEQIPIRVRNIFEPQAPGTLIQVTRPRTPWVVRSVARRRGFSVVNLSGPAMAYTQGLASKVFTALSQAGVNVYTMAASMASFSVVVEEADVGLAVRSLGDLDRRIVKEIATRDKLSLISLVGMGLRETKGIAARTFDAVAAAGVNVELISDGGSDIALNFIVRTEDDDKAIAALHQEFIQSERDIRLM